MSALHNEPCCFPAWITLLPAKESSYNNIKFTPAATLFLRKILLLELNLSCCVFRCAKGKASYQIWQKKENIGSLFIRCLKITWVRQERLGDVNIDEKLELNWQIIKACNSFRELRSEKVKVIHRWFERFYSNDLEFHVTASSSHSVRVFCIVIVFSSWRSINIWKTVSEGRLCCRCSTYIVISRHPKF